MNDWFERVILGNYGGKHFLELGRENTVEDGKVNVKWFGRKVYTKEERDRLNEIQELINKEDEIQINLL